MPKTPCRYKYNQSNAQWAGIIKLHPEASYCLRLVGSLGPGSGLDLRFASGRVLYMPRDGNSGPGLAYPLVIELDMEYAGVLYGDTPVVISATLGRKCVPRGVGSPVPKAANASPSFGLVGGTDLGVLSLRAAIARPVPMLLPRI
jgi:hypothetical protein